MDASRTYRRFTHRDANFRICCDTFDVVCEEIVRLRDELEEYLTRHPEFGESLEPVDALDHAPESAQRMSAGAALAGVGPMASVAGTMAQLAARAGAAECAEAIVENGGDIFIIADRPVVVGLFAGRSPVGDRLALRVEPDRTPVAICSSSSRMGHSLSLGDCDLATVVAADAALADAAATRAANLVKCPADVDAALEAVGAINGVAGALIVKDDRVGLIGDLPPLAANRDAELKLKVTRDRSGL